MKVGTDGVLLGSWAHVQKATSILDIGTGTGLIALMLAQRNPQARIQAIDIDTHAACQAQDNINQSPWKGNIQVEAISLQDFTQKYKTKFDHIVSNPPFFTEGLRSEDTSRSTARHTDYLSYKTLLQESCQLLGEQGRISLILPYEYESILLTLAKDYLLNPLRILRMRPTPTKAHKRSLIELSLLSLKCRCEEMVIEAYGRHGYSEDYMKLTQDFYLKF